MAKFKNVSPLGALDIDALRLRGVEAGEEFEVPDDLVHAFLGQEGTFEPVKVPAAALKEWDALVAADVARHADTTEIAAPAEVDTDAPGARGSEGSK